jgi:JmjC domain
VPERTSTDAPYDSDRPACPSPLDRCVGLDAATFAATHYGVRPVLTRAGDFAAVGTAPGFTDLIDLDPLDELLSRRGLRTPFLRVAKDGVVVPADRYTGGGGLGAEVRDQVHDDRVLDLVADGATLVFQGLHRLWPPLIDFAGALAAELGCAVQANAYLTPPGNRGFATHYDTHDVFVLQVSGHKHWRIHEPVLADPLDRQPWGGRADEVSATAAGEATLDEVLGPGDALYLPRGWLHAADARDETSLHVTLGLRRPTRYDIVESLLALAGGEVRLRTGFALGFDPTDPGRLGAQLRSTVDALKAWLDTVDSETVARHLRTRLWSATRPAPLRPLAQAALLRRVEPGLAIRL